MWIAFGAGLGHKITLGYGDSQWNFGDTLCELFWTNRKVMNGQLSVDLSEYDKNGPGARDCKAGVRVEEGGKGVWGT